MYGFLVMVFVAILLWGLSKWNEANHKILEKFSDIEKSTMGRFQRFSEIIKAFEEVNGKKPSPTELHAFYDEFSEVDSFTSAEVSEVLRDQARYHRILGDFLQTNNVDEESEEVIDSSMEDDAVGISEIDDEGVAKLVSKVFAETFPGEKLTNDNREFLMYKLSKFNNDVALLKEYLTGNDEYAQYIRKKLDGQFTRDKAGPGDSALVPESTTYKISRPHLYNKTLEEEKADNADNEVDKVEVDGYTCEDLEDEQVLSKIISARNMDQLKYACLKSKDKNMRTDDDMVLIKGLEWSVPQQRPGVCRMSKTQDYHYSTEQSSLIGTLLDEADNTKVGSIMPEFEFKETEVAA